MRHLDAPEDQVPPHWQSVFAVEDCDGALAKVEELGGQKLLEPMDVPTIGRFALVQDPVGAVFQVIKLEPPRSSTSSSRHRIWAHSNTRRPAACRARWTPSPRGSSTSRDDGPQTTSS